MRKFYLRTMDNKLFSSFSRLMRSKMRDYQYEGNPNLVAIWERLKSQSLRMLVNNGYITEEESNSVLTLIEMKATPWDRTATRYREWHYEQLKEAIMEETFTGLGT